MKEKKEIYGEGGFDKNKPNNNIISTEEIDVSLFPISRKDFFLELSKRNLYKNVINNLNKLTEGELIIFNETDLFTREMLLMEKIKVSAKINDATLDDIFYQANLNQ